MDYLTKFDTGPNLGLTSGGAGDLGPMTDPETGLPINTTDPANSGSAVVTPIPGAQAPGTGGQAVPVNMATIVDNAKQNWPVWLAIAGIVAALVAENEKIKMAGIAAAGIGVIAHINKQQPAPTPIPEPTA